MSDAPPIACTLTATDFKARAAIIRELASGSLLAGRRKPLQLHLTYAANASANVRDVIRQEQACCGFLTFEVREDVAGVHVTVTAPEQARESADALFAHFLPDAAQQPDQKKYP